MHRPALCKARVTRPAALFLLCLLPASLQAQTGLVCTLSATKAEGEAGAGSFLAGIDCTPGEMPPDVYDANRDRTHLTFPATAGERVIIGASLTEEAPSDWTTDSPQPDYDFPIRYITIPAGPDAPRWSLSADPAAVAGYGHLILRVWNPAALTECPTGRDGCEKYGYALLMDELRADDALELPLR